MVYEELMTNPVFLTGIIVLSVWIVIWKGIALWKAGRNNQLIWFMFMLLLNTAGILEIIYLIGFHKPANRVFF